MVLLLEGRIHAFVKATSNTYAWDTCAPDAILRANGGKLSDICGQPYHYGNQAFPRQNNQDGGDGDNGEAPRVVAKKQTRGIMATGSVESHERYMRMIPDVVKEHHGWLVCGFVLK